MQDGTQGASDREVELDFDPIAERFFSQPPQPCEIVHDDWQAEPLSSLERVAMLTTAAPAMAMLAVAITWLISDPLLTASVKNAARLDAMPIAEPIAIEPVAPPPAEVRAPEVPPVAVLAAPNEHVVARLATPVRAARSPAAPRRSKTPSAAKRARQRLDAGDAAGARDLARDAVRSAPDRAAGYIVLAAALDKLGDRAGKAAAFRSCAQLATDSLAASCQALARER
jgi:hypothetical protein